MNSTDIHDQIKFLRITSQAFLAAKAVHQDLGKDDDGTSTLTSVSRSGQTLLSNTCRIPLQIGTFANILKNTETTPTDITGVQEILQFFIDIGNANNLSSTPVVSNVQAALDACRQGTSLKSVSRAPWNDIIQTRQHSGSYSMALRSYIIHGIPLFNIWDDLSYLYTLCCEDIFTDRECELHIYQLRLAILALNKSA